MDLVLHSAGGDALEPMRPSTSAEDWKAESTVRRLPADFEAVLQTFFDQRPARCTLPSRDNPSLSDQHVGKLHGRSHTGIPVSTLRNNRIVDGQDTQLRNSRALRARVVTCIDPRSG